MKIRLRLFASTIKGLIRKFFVSVVQWTRKKRTNKCDVRAELLFCPHEHIQNVFVVVVTVGAVVA